jgi:hypothetical protein
MENVLVGDEIQNIAQINSLETSWSSQQHTLHVVSAEEKAQFDAANIFRIANNTLQGAFDSSIIADPNNVVEFRVTISNISEYDARNVALLVTLPVVASRQLTPQLKITSDNADSIESHVTISSDVPVYLAYRVSSATFYGRTDLLDCPNGCSMPESFYLEPLVLGTVHAGSASAIQVDFDADMLPASLQPPTRTPTPPPRPFISRNESILSIIGLTIGIIAALLAIMDFVNKYIKKPKVIGKSKKAS